MNKIFMQPFKAFLEGQMSEGKPTTLIAIKILLISVFCLSSFLHRVIFTSVTTSH